MLREEAELGASLLQRSRRISILHLLLVLACVDLAETQGCFSVQSGGIEHSPVAVLKEVQPWVAAGFPSLRKGSVLADLREGFHFVEPPDGLQDAQPLVCYTEMVGFSFAVMNVGYDIDDKAWDGFLNMLTWDDTVAHSDWPFFDLVNAWASAQPSGGVDLFTRTLQGCDRAAMEVWQSGAMQAASRAIAEAMRSGPGGLAPAGNAALQAALVALLGIVDVSLFGTVCTALPWILVTHLLALVPDDPLVTPAYALYFTQTALRVRSSGPTRERILGILPVLPLLPHSARAEGARWTELSNAESLKRASALGFDAFGPLHTSEARLISEALRVADTFLALLGVQYIAIGGTLLGAVRHLDRIPWDDDVDLCVDAAHEGLLLGLTAAQEAKRLGGPDPGGLSWHARRALRYLAREGHVLRITAGKAITFSIERKASAGAADAQPAVSAASAAASAASADLWMCWGLEEPSPVVPEGEIVFQSLLHGPRMSRHIVTPRRPLPFGRLVIWGPAHPHEVLTATARHLGWPHPWLSTCRGRARPALTRYARARVIFDERHERDCSSLIDRFQFAEPWAPLAEGAEVAEIQKALGFVFAARLPGLLASSSEAAFEMLGAALGASAPPRLQARGSVATAAGETLWCEAFLWQGNEAEDMLEPGAVIGTNLVVRSLHCSELGATAPRIVWPAWADRWP